jgi:hypothetical protein
MGASSATLPGRMIQNRSALPPSSNRRVPPGKTAAWASSSSRSRWASVRPVSTPDETLITAPSRSDDGTTTALVHRRVSPGDQAHAVERLLTARTTSVEATSARATSAGSPSSTCGRHGGAACGRHGGPACSRPGDRGSWGSRGCWGSRGSRGSLALPTRPPGSGNAGSAHRRPTCTDHCCVTTSPHPSGRSPSLTSPRLASGPGVLPGSMPELVRPP